MTPLAVFCKCFWKKWNLCFWFVRGWAQWQGLIYAGALLHNLNNITNNTNNKFV